MGCKLVVYCDNLPVVRMVHKFTPHPFEGGRAVLDRGIVEWLPSAGMNSSIQALQVLRRVIYGLGRRLGAGIAFLAL